MSSSDEKCCTLLANKYNSALINNQTLFTDIINIFYKKELPGHNSYQIVVTDKTDEFIFRFHYQNVINVNDSNKKCDHTKNIIVNVNMTTPQANTANLFTIPREGVGNKEFIIFPMKNITIIQDPQEQTTELCATQLGLCIDQPHNLRDKIWASNPSLNSLETFKLILQMLCVVNIKITKDMYSHIKNPLNSYSMYRHIMIYDNYQGIINPYLYSIPITPAIKSTYSLTGIPLHQYP